MTDSFRLLLAFDSDDPGFRRGFESALIYRDSLELEPGRGFVRQIHADNAEMVMRIAEATGCAFSAQDDGHDWMTVSLTKAES